MQAVRDEAARAAEDHARVAAQAAVQLDQAELLSLLDQIGAQLLGDNDNESIANAMHGEHQLRLHLPKEP